MRSCTHCPGRPLTRHCIGCGFQVPAGLRDTTQDGEKLPALSSLVNDLPSIQGGLGAAIFNMRADQLWALQQQIQILAARSSVAGHACPANFNYQACLAAAPSPSPGALQASFGPGVLYPAQLHAATAGSGSVSIASLLSEGESPPTPATRPQSSTELGACSQQACAEDCSNRSKDKAPGCKHTSTSTKLASKDDECMSDDSTKTAATLVSGPASNERCSGRKPSGRRCQWSPEEHQRFLTGLTRFGPKDAGSGEAGARMSVGLGPGVAEVIAVVVGTRTVSQVRSHAQKYFLRQTRKNGAVPASK